MNIKHIIRKDRSSINVSRGGLAIFFDNTTKYQELPLEDTNLEFMAITIKKLNVVTIYRRECDSTIVSFLINLQNLMTQISSINSYPCIFQGDFNVDTNSSFTDFMDRKGYRQIVNQCTVASGRCIDHVCVPNNTNITFKIYVEDCYYSDHHKIYVSISNL